MTTTTAKTPKATKAKKTATPPEGMTPKQAALELKVPARKVRIFARKLFKADHEHAQTWAFTPDQVEQLRKAMTPPS